MTARTEKRGFASRPGGAEGWIKAGEISAVRGNAVAAFTARLTIDITPELRGRIKIAAFRRGVTASDMLRDLLEREFPGTQGGDTP
ncbi:hypothetical protein J3P71_02045 [Rhizobium leguminosarum]|uniref:hypothetical protein n=1 Tax=Rhizobium leguminosarum TaxID=384 RepID=UPI000DD4DE81|nr:hypothetical protein [Rhizobium leguminosarum]MBY5836268.1 hypothetical protein [Rhizobium leguminosarum]NKM79040.1 hypothetical protein [Rhizobium leguminosarum bv. viciae]QSZ08586.1 hypothetical protein J3P71_02045 [Rhizobium leguminosarum]